MTSVPTIADIKVTLDDPNFVGRCDKCGKPVMLDNDALALEYLIKTGMLPSPFERLNYGARHLLRTETCEGSPSRAQYLPGQPLDTRGYHYHKHLEAPTRQAYQRLLDCAQHPDLLPCFMEDHVVCQKCEYAGDSVHDIANHPCPGWVI